MSETNDRNGWLDPSVQAALNYLLTPLFFGITTGPIYGGITGVMMNMAGTASMRTRVLRHTALFCKESQLDYIEFICSAMMGLSYGLSGIASVWMRSEAPMSVDEWKRKDDYMTSMVSGCSAGLALGLASTKTIL